MCALYLPLTSHHSTGMAVSFHDNQIQASEEIIQIFRGDGVEKKPFTVLLAQMQSGKTGGYLYTAFEMIRQELVDQVEIICGSADLSLRNQLVTQVDGSDETEDSEEIEPAMDIYQDFRSENYPGEHIKRKIQKKFSKVKVYFSNDIKKRRNPLKPRTLIIHDESHMAQSKDNKPFKDFYRKYSIEQALHGDYSRIIEDEIYILGVSATPFSEIVANQKVRDNDWTNEELSFINGNLETKGFHLMEPGEGYIGVHQLLEAGCIKFVADEIKSNVSGIKHVADVLRDNASKYNKKYCVIRTHRAEKDKEIVESIARSCGYDYIPVFGDSGRDLEFMEKIPQRGTVVHICGRFRMGQVVPKRNIAMVYEQSKDPNADTILQGLVGRMCGYVSGGAHTSVDIFVAPSTQEWIEKYDHAWSTSQSEVLSGMSKAMNLGGTRRKNSGDIISANGTQYIKTIPVKFNLKDLERGISGEVTRFSQITASDIHNLLTPSEPGDDYRSKPELIEGNRDKDHILRTLEVLKRGVAVNGKDKDKPHHNRESVHPEYKSVYEEAHSNGKPANFTTYARHEIQFSVYGGSSDGVCFLLGYVPYDSSRHGEIQEELAAVHPKCNYIPSGEITMEDNSVMDGANGAQLIKFDWNTSEDSEILRSELSKAIERSLRDPSVERAIHSIFDTKTNGFSGIVLSKEVYDDEMIREIENDLNQLHNVKLKFKKSRGRQPKDYIRFTSISW